MADAAGGSQRSMSRFIRSRGTRPLWLRRRRTSALRRTLFHDDPFALFQHARAQPFLDEAHDVPIREPVLEKLDQPGVGQPVEKAAHVQIQHPVQLLLLRANAQLWHNWTCRFDQKQSSAEPVNDTIAQSHQRNGKA